MVCLESEPVDLTDTFQTTSRVLPDTLPSPRGGRVGCLVSGQSVVPLTTQPRVFSLRDSTIFIPNIRNIFQNNDNLGQVMHESCYKFGASFYTNSEIGITVQKHLD